MKRYDEYLTETLANEIKTEPVSIASKEAKKMGLTYVGFGRYSDAKGKVAYVVQDGRLVPFKGMADVQSMYAKASTMPNPQKSQETYATAETFGQVYKNRQKEDKKIFRVKEKEILQTDKELNKYYSKIISDEDMQTIGSYIESADSINRYLYKGFDDGTDSQTASGITDVVSAMDEIMDRTITPIPFSVYVALSERYASEKLKSDNKFLFRGYTSASLDYNVVLEAMSDSDKAKVLCQIEVPQGQRAVHIDSEDMETILPRATTIQIISGPHPINPDEFDDVMLFHCTLVEE